MKILFIGCVESSYRLLKVLLENHKNVLGVMTKEKSDFNSDFCDLAPLCRQYGIPYQYVKNANDADSISFVRRVRPDICLCFGWSQLLKEDFIGMFPMGVVGFHPAALPYNRGRHPLIWALALGLCETVSRITQSGEKGNAWRKRSKTDGVIDWRMSCRGIYNLVRSLTRPYVGAHFVYNGREYKVWKVQEIDTPNMQNLEPGKIIAVNLDGTIDVKAGDNGIRLLEFDTFEAKTGDYII